jgi:hypothetical protein
MHELTQFVDHGLQEWPVSLQEVRELARHVHDVSRDLRFVTLAFGLLTEIEQLLDHLDDKTFFFLPVETSRDRAKSPAQLVESVVREVLLVLLQLLKSVLEDLLCFSRILVCEED